MPGTGIAGFRSHAGDRPRRHLRLRHPPRQDPRACIIRHWKIDQLTGLNDGAEKARDRLFKRMERIGRVGGKLRDKREARVPAPA